MKPGNLKPLENKETVPFLHNSRQVEATSAVTSEANNQGTLMLGGHETWEFKTSGEQRNCPVSTQLQASRGNICFYFWGKQPSNLNACRP